MARNTGARASSAPLLLFLDDDIDAGPDLLKMHLEAQDSWPGAIVVGAVRLAANDTPFGRFRQRLEDAGVPPGSGPVAAPNFCTAQNMSIPRSRFLELGGFDPGMVSGEDQDLAMRHTAAGGRIVFVREAEAVHNDSATDLRSYCRRHEWGAEHMIPFLERYPEWPENRERVAVNGPVRWGRDSARRIAMKGAKRLLGTVPGRELLFALASFLERTAPKSPLLPWVYRLALGVHLQAGFRRGWAQRREAPGSGERA